MLVEFTQTKDSYQPFDRLWLLAHTTKGLVSHKPTLALDSVKFSAGSQSHGISPYKLYEEKSMDNGQLCEKKWWTSRFLIMAVGALEHYTSTISRIILRNVLYSDINVCRLFYSLYSYNTHTCICSIFTER